MATTIITSTTQTPRKLVPRNYAPGGFDFATEAVFFEDWLKADSPSSTELAGNMSWFFKISGGTLNIVPIAGGVGVLDINVTSGRSLVSQDFSSIILGSNAISIRMRVQLNILANATDSYNLLLGLGDAEGTSVQTDGIYFYYDQLSAFWKCVTSSSGTQTVVTTTTTVAAATWYTLGIDINAAGTSVVFSLGSSNSTLATIATITTNIPVGTTRAMGPLMRLLKTKGNQSRSCYNDYYWLYASLGSER